jgi:sortase A
MLIGLLLVLAPPAMTWYYDWSQERLLAEIEMDMTERISNPMTSQNQGHLQTEYSQLSELFEREASAGVPMMESGSVDGDDSEVVRVTSKQPEPVQQAIAIIEIDKIKLKLPVLEGATQDNMKFAAAHMKETTAIGEVGNAAIAAHRARKNGRLFNRLDELEVGDQIRVRIGDEEFIYTVFKTSIVDPTDISVLGTNDKDAVLTLITCDPVVDPTHRLIVHAKL